MPRKELDRFHVKKPRRFRKRRERKLSIQLAQRKREHQRARAEENLTSSSALLISDAPKLRGSFRRAWRWSLVWLSLLSFMGVTLTAGVLWLTKLPPPTNCQNLSHLATDGDRLFCAQVGATSGKLEKLEAAITLVQKWSPNHPLYPESRRMLEKWSGVILEIAQQKISQGNQSEAVSVASKVPVNSPLYPEAQALIATWKQEWQRSEALVNQVKEALKVQKWQQASQSIAELSASKRKYWSISRVDALMRQMAAEKLAWEQLEEARDLAKLNQLEQLEEAIALAGKVNPNSYVKSQAKAEQTQWSRTIVQIAVTYFDQQEYASAVNVLERIPANTPLYQEAQDWIHLGRASEMAKKDTIVALLDAIAAVRQIEPKSPLYSKASTQATLWQSQLQDHTKLQAARLFASFDQQKTLKIAIAQAVQVAPKRPQRIFAQTLIAQWRKEIQHIEDRNQLISAQQLAERGTLRELKTAVEIASTIGLGQPLRLDAQSAIAKWNRQIQTIEDQPILDLAQAFAQRRDLIAAISTARQIRSDRPLYAQAQAAISDWVAQVQTAEDRPILEAAAALAAQGRFDAAIATISQISPERALYSQAEALKSAWLEQSAALNREAQSVTPEAY